MYRDDITNKKFNMLTAISHHSIKNKKHYWLFKCECGVEVVKRRDQVLSGKFKTCGNHDKNKDNRHVEIIDKKFGRLTAVKRVENNKHNQEQYIFTCDCGNTKIINKNTVLIGQSNSCGCLQKEKIKQQGYKNQKEFGLSAMNQLFNNYIQSAKKRNYEFALTKSQFISLVIEKCFYCGEIPNQIKKSPTSQHTFKYNGIDRKNNKLGYEIDNCVSCCGKCNRMKYVLNSDEFLNHIKKILEYSNV